MTMVLMRATVTVFSGGRSAVRIIMSFRKKVTVIYMENSILCWCHYDTTFQHVHTVFPVSTAK